MLAQKNPYIKSAYEHLQVISRDKEKRLAYKAREKTIRDYNQLIKEAEIQEKKIGREAGEKIGRETSKKCTITYYHITLTQNRIWSRQNKKRTDVC